MKFEYVHLKQSENINHDLIFLNSYLFRTRYAISFLAYHVDAKEQILSSIRVIMKEKAR